ncbi:MAG: hypothetical protein ACI9TH_004260 [Kiritimatiellia bacterium]|jgi:hypothetical protein
MNISFDLDDTLILHPQDRQTHTHERLLLTGEYLRRGTTELLSELSRAHHIYLYTSSFRSPLQLGLSFLLKGIRIRKIINGVLHDQIIRKYHFKNPPTKLPSHFGIDLHIDNDSGVVDEGGLHGFQVLLIDPDDQDWVTTIQHYLNPPTVVPHSEREPPPESSIYH